MPAWFEVAVLPWASELAGFTQEHQSPLGSTWLAICEDVAMTSACFDAAPVLESGCAVVVVGTLRIAVFRLGDRLHAIEEVCPHMGGPLSEGRLHGCAVICPWHGARFDVRTGAVLTPPAGRGVRSFAVELEGTRLRLEISEQE